MDSEDGDHLVKQATALVKDKADSDDDITAIRAQCTGKAKQLICHVPASYEFTTPPPEESSGSASTTSATLPTSASSTSLLTSMASTSVSAMFSTAGAAEDSDISPPPSDNKLVDGPLMHKGTDPTLPNIASTSACTANTMPSATGNLTTGLAKSKKKGSAGKKTHSCKNGF
ncbi:hypothetical protein SCLCIDRAFT_26404 [Scleroderma citrinum Foug A]|uniref:Uncharacterized protein n=1 Tax=Scleroderma citrinum Foug A TaxID=1036808 RepID=A0A0C3DXV4_9AGAM|nr:hypothetical protein SCLCIDRAFT_26404 [Scleroderma citrinum Foug A]